MFKNKGQIIQFIYFILGMCLLGILTIAAVKDMRHSSVGAEYDGSVSVENLWYDEYGHQVDLNALTKVPKADTGEWVSIYCTMPDSIPAGSSLCMRTGYIYFRVLLEGELLYEPIVPESIFYNKSFGHASCMVPISESASGKELEIQYSCSYPSEKAYIRNAVLGSGSAYFLHQVKEDGIAFFASTLLLFMGLVFILMSIPIVVKNHSGSELIYLGLLSVFVAIWSISETHLIQMAFDNSRTMNLMADLALMMIPVPAILYTDMAIKNRLTRPAKILVTLSVCQIFGSVLAHLLGIAEFRSLLFTTHIVIVIGAFYILFRVVVATVRRELESALVYRVFRMIGLVTFVWATLIDLIRYYLGVGEDRAGFVRLGLLIFVACYGIASTEKTVRAVEKAAEAEFITKLAYEDGLTGVGNRTAYQEYLEEIKERLQEDRSLCVGVVVFDVNDLKVTNDQEGHIWGDKLIKVSANTICKSFSDPEDRIFRIGGDEFVVVALGENLKKKLAGKMEAFRENVKLFNESEENEKKNKFVLSVACGMAYYGENGRGDTLAKVVERADTRMYENKMMIKGKRHLENKVV